MSLLHRSLTNQLEKPWDQRLQTLLALILGLNILPHFWSIPTWASLWGAVAVAWKLAYLKRGLPLPRRSALGIGALIAAALTYFVYDTILGVEAASCFLVLLASLKLLETNRYRDAMLVIFTSYFLLMTHVLISQSLVSTLFMAFDILLITSLMFHMHKRDRRNSVRGFRPAMRMLALTLPVWFLFFFLFPRFTAAVWDLKTAGNRTGFSEDMSPGSIEELIQNDETAFRVTFRTRSPSPESLYWRGDVLTQGDGLRWTKGRPDQTPRQIDRGQPPLSEYDIVLEPGFQRWLFVLDYVKRFRAGELLARSGINRTASGTFRANREFSVRVGYSATSGRDFPVESMTPDERAANLQIPSGLSPRILALANQLSKQELTKGIDRSLRLAERVRNYFPASGFRYSLKPGAAATADSRGQLDEFLFDKKLGFCEHYSAAYATLMRLVGVPARVVVGFQGGKYNDFGNYLLVRHLDAHAWTEIWLAGEGSAGRWVRVDLTQEIAPLRLQLGGDFYRLDSQQLAGLSEEELRRQLNGAWSQYALRAQLFWDAVQMRWNAFLMDYDLSYQLELLTRLGFRNASALLLLAGLGLGLLAIASVFIFVLKRRSKRPDPVVQTWSRFCRSLARVGISREENEGPLHFTERAARARPSVATEIHSIGRSYIYLRYGGLVTSDRNTDSISLALFRTQVRRFSPPKTSSSVESDS